VFAVVESPFDPSRLHHAETIFTIGNGYLSSRGTFEESYPDEWRTTFVHGVFDAVPIAYTEIANMPDWTAMFVELDGETFRMDRGMVQEYRRELDLRTGELTRSLRWTSPGGVAARLEFRRFASLADEHLAVVTVHVTAEQDCGVRIRVPVSSAVGNLNDKLWVAQHTDHVATLGDESVAGVAVQTREKRYCVAVAARVSSVGEPVSRQRWEMPDACAIVLDYRVSAGDVVGAEKVVAYESSRDSEPGGDVAATALRRAREADVVDVLAAANAQRWDQDWEACDIEIDGDDEAQLAVRFSIFHLLIVGPRHDNRVNIGAKALSGYGYRGHTFWDTEIFMLPLFTYTRPDIARNLLDYRWNLLGPARQRALAEGFEGARFPWESADTGDEVTPAYIPDWDDRNKLIRIWAGDIEIHISADIAYGAMTYWRATGDDEWFASHGAELVVDTARFYVSRAEHDPDGSVHYRDVIGPDEYHDHVDDNAFTNGMARWNIRTALEVLAWLGVHRTERAAELREELALTDAVLGRWAATADAIVLPVLPDGRIPQFNGYFDRHDALMADYEPRTRSMHEILGIDGANDYQAIKQPDVLMLTLLLEDEFTDEVRQANYDYYSPRTDHTYGSSLGPSMQAIIAARAGLAEDAVEHFRRAALADLRDVRGNAADGIHAASCGGIWQAVVFGFAGVKIGRDGSVTTHPALPQRWRRVAFTLTVRGERHRVEVTA
jgi:trehalose/maltose hydrolase-like predicted phosphorylase